jgi:hypothetical protein
MQLEEKTPPTAPGSAPVEDFDSFKSQIIEPGQYFDIVHERDEQIAVERIIAVGLSPDKHSIFALEWALDNLVRAGDLIILMHVRHVYAG